MIIMIIPVRSKIILWLSSIVLLGTQNSHSFRLPRIKLPDIKTRFVFANCLRKSIGDFITGKTEFDRDWATIYQADQKSIQDSHQAAQNFAQIVKTNTQINLAEFKFGLSSSAYQFEGGIGDKCASTRFYDNKSLATPGNACNFWNNYETMIKEMAEQAHIKIFRLETLWSRIQPDGPDTFDAEALQHYKKIIKTLKKYNIEPLVVFHHYTIPTWFENIGGFAKEENINHFVQFCVRVYRALCDEVTYWSTFNAVEGYAFKGYYTGEGSPGEKGDMQKTATVIKNMLESHVHVYKAIKKNYQIYAPKYKKHHKITIPEPQIGIQKNILPIDPPTRLKQKSLLVDMKKGINWKRKLLLVGLTSSTATLFSRIICGIGNMFQNEGFYNFFTSGEYRVYIPTKALVKHKNSDAPKCLDWIGVNTYSNRYMFLGKEVKEQKPEKQTLNPNYRFYPEGIYRAVKEVADRIAKPIGTLKGIDSIPIWITENGIPTEYDNKEDDTKRERFFQQALHTISHTIEDGYRVEAYLPWASHDNYEWGSEKGFGTKPYGFFHVNPERPNDPHPLKKGSEYFCNFVEAFYK